MHKRPFSLTADLDFLYASDHHQRVFEETLAAIQRRDGLICVVGDSGTGKTILCRRLLQELNGDFNVVLVNTPPRTPQDITETLDTAFRDMEGDSKIPLAVFDEAQHLDFRCLDHVKFLTNLDRNAEKLLQIVLVGQPELAAKLGHKRFQQLEQRIGAKLKVGPLKKKEVLPYLTHRLTVAGLADEIRFTGFAARYLHRKTSGVPRLINRVANLAVEQAGQRGGKIGVGQVRQSFLKVAATRENWITPKKPAFRLGRLSALVLLLVLSLLALLYYNPEWRALVVAEPADKSRSQPAASRFVIKTGTFLVRDQAEELRGQLGKQGFPSAVVEKQFGDGWTLYQVRLAGQYSKDESDTIIDLLRTIGVKSVDAVEMKP
ncbi:MAG: hypothetical protein A3C54_02495 [Deltaproteobacteria bacterium RIFCSPHIGHO2_02_FULL_60_17]|nr:MAG: hypothetical protein A3C54_02495 [Deltaproteobacteria bacterium RIFCSPHIGHO2_02_FULL_60_17]OGQ75008.1 MAG: hypothetical protein A3G94_03385 [Deltaproteobacteria bacterium RIFCSPLOWO2_12_FULL_60_16]